MLDNAMQFLSCEIVSGLLQVDLILCKRFGFWSPKSQTFAQDQTYCYTTRCLSDSWNGGCEYAYDYDYGDYREICPEDESEDEDVVEKEEEDHEDNMDTILFPLFEVPLMTEEIESALTGNLEDGQLFRDIWKGLFDSPDTVPLNIGKHNSKTEGRF